VRRHIVMTLGVVVISGAIGGGAWWSFSDTRDSSDDRPISLLRGHELYLAYCAACHGAQLEGQPNWQQRRENGRLPAPPHNAAGHTWHHSDRQLFELTKHGVAGRLAAAYESDMPAFADRLSDAEIRAVLAYIRTQWPPEIRARQAEITRRADR
jgi:mono/diheme cytochrome c family protein